MSEDFDIYSELLGIAAGPRPPDYYRLLGIPLFEPDLARINEATRDRIASLTAMVAGPHSAEVQRLLAEIATARAALITPVVKQRYDARLRQSGAAGGAEAAGRGAADVDMLLPPRAADVSLVQKTTAVTKEAMGLFPGVAQRTQTSPWAQPVTAPPPPPSSAAAPAIVTARLISGPGTAHHSPPPSDNSPFEAPGASLASNPWPDAPPPFGAEPQFDPVLDPVSGVKRAPTTRRQRSEALILILASLFVALVAIVGTTVYWHRPMTIEGQPPAMPDVQSPQAMQDAALRRAEKPSATEGPNVSPSTAVARDANSPPRMSSTPVRPDADRADGAAPSMPARPSRRLPLTEKSETMTKSGAGGATKTPAAGPATTQAFDKSLADAKKAIARRDFGAADELLDLALLDASTDELRARIEGVKILRHHVDRFWNAVRESMKTLDSGHEIIINGEPVVIVEVSPDWKNLVIRAKGENRQYETQQLPANIAVALAENWLATDDVNSKAFVGAFLVIDERGDKQRGRRLLGEAQTAGSEAATAVLEQLDR